MARAAVRFVAPIRGTLELKDPISREILRELRRSKISIASATLEIVSVPKLRIEENRA